MKITWTHVGLVLLVFIACVSFLFYLLAQGAEITSLPLILLIWGIVFCAGGLVACIVWAAGWLPRKRKT